MIGLREDQHVKAQLIARINQLFPAFVVSERGIRPAVACPASKGAG